jgi:hypothetical protein
MLFDYCDAACADGITDEWRGRASPNKGHFLTNQPDASSQCYGLRLPKIGVSRGTFSGETVWQAAHPSYSNYRDTAYADGITDAWRQAMESE